MYALPPSDVPEDERWHSSGSSGWCPLLRERVTSYPHDPVTISEIKRAGKEEEGAG